MALVVKRRSSEIVAVMLGARVEMEVAHWGHRHLARMEREEFAPLDGDARIVNRIAEDSAGERNLARC
jgi:hypothetical protein